jgi:hypothetical protein
MNFIHRHEVLRGPLATAVGAVVLLGFAVELAHAASPAGWIERLVPLFSLSYEQNVPTWFASCLLFACGVLLLLIGLDADGARPPPKRYWYGLAAIFAYLSLDEFVGFHEHLSGLLELDGILYFSWVVPAGVIVAIAGTAFVPFLRRLPPRARRQFLIAGAIYVGGALGMELPLGWWTERAGNDNLVYALIDGVEESMELAGAMLFLLALVEYLHAPAIAAAPESGR